MMNYNTLSSHTLLKLIAITLLIALPSSLFAIESPAGIGGIGLHNSYNLGKSIYLRKLACAGCPMDNKNLDSSTAKVLVDKLNSNENFAGDLKGIKRQSVIVYLTHRYKMS